MPKKVLVEIVAPNGALTTCHKIESVTIKGNVVAVLLNSFATPESGQIVWQDTYDMPISDWQAAAYPANVESWIAALHPSAVLIGEEEPLEVAKLEKVALVHAERERRISAGHMIEGVGRFDTDAHSRENIMGAFSLALAAMATQQPFAIDWRLADDTMVSLDAAGMMGVGAAVAARKEACYVRSWQLKGQIEAAPTIEDLDSFDLSTGWP